MASTRALVNAEPTLAALLARYPWSDAERALGPVVEGLMSFQLDAPPGAVWPIVSDTSRMNRAIGLTRMEFEEREGLLHGRSRNAGIVHEWVEVPWAWVAERSLYSVRRYSRGVVHVARAVYELTPLGDEGCRFDVYFGFVARGLLGRLLLPLTLSMLRSGYRRAIEDIGRMLDSDGPTTFRLPPPEPPPSDVLERHRRSLLDAGVSEAATERLIQLVRSEDDMELVRIRALSLVHDWGLDEGEVLLAFLHATRAGLLHMSWDVICPHCRGVRAEVSTLGEVPRRGSCEVCAIDFDTDSENAIEVTFHVHPSVRAVPEVFFCSAEPARKEHIRLQLPVAPGDSTEVAPVLLPGRYRLRVQGEQRHALLDVEPGASQEPLAWSSAAPTDARVAPGTALVLSNEGDHTRTFIVERAHWTDEALRPARLFSFQGFRDLFTEEYVGSDIQLSVGQQTILFTDVVGSTALYAERGDPGAFVEVKRHFGDIYEEVRKNNGAIVKTIGDAAMASFVDPVRALATAAAIQRRLPPGREDLRIRVRASLHAGPCIAVKLNTNIDYFGSTVNGAAKLQACAGAGEVAFCARLLELPGVRDLLDAEAANLGETTFASPALGGDVRVLVWRVTPDEA